MMIHLSFILSVIVRKQLYGTNFIYYEPISGTIHPQNWIDECTNFDFWFYQFVESHCNAQLTTMYLIDINI